MKLSNINEGSIKLRRALRSIYGRGDRPAGFMRPKLHQSKNATPTDQGNRSLGGRSSDPGTPWKLRHRKFFNVDAGEGSVRY